ncbi:oxidoreductase [Halalkalibacter wakoensis JCM 9140]|uniref:Oxidoreductase n=1 Tax=Halalkalibacter wakoensis JCM 9140 TaxID=1236970 RepID=W4Q6Y6_9BACI|nr:Gfo/Idh/MocA family oxidoreductase [Halalkalibacter wakoensis]GAE27826.1 oxidoreductase [Halalkalibacter wakoensis JCM 9140]
MSEKIKWGIVGTAGIAKNAIVPAILRANNAEVVAVASRGNKQKADEFADLFQIEKTYESYDDLLNDKEIQAVYIPLPNNLHAEWVKKAARKGKHVLCEKPAALTEEETKSMVDVCNQEKVVFMEAFMYQFHPQHDRVKEIIRSGEIGDVSLMRSSFSFFLDVESENIRLDAQLGGGSLYDIGCYCIHASRFILEKEPNQVFAASNHRLPSGVDLTTTGILTFNDGVTASFSCSFQQPFENGYEVVGTNGKIKVPFAFRPDVEGGKGEIVITNKDGESRTEVVNGDQYALQIEHFSHCILTNEKPSYDGTKSIENMKVLEGCLVSLQNNKIVQL